MLKLASARAISSCAVAARDFNASIASFLLINGASALNASCLGFKRCSRVGRVDVSPCSANSARSCMLKLASARASSAIFWYLAINSCVDLAIASRSANSFSNPVGAVGSSSSANKLPDSF